MNSILTGIFLAGFAFITSANPVRVPADSTPLLPAYRQVVEQAANVRYPQRLSVHAEASKAYVEQFSKQRRDYLIRMYQRGKSYFPKIRKIFARYEVPVEYQVLIAMESGFNAKAVSRAGAVGYWQIMDAVAKEYGMTISAQTIPGRGKKLMQKKPVASRKSSAVPAVADDRMHFIKSTQVAARYIRDRRRNLNDDWLLIAASYNCGVGTVWNAMQQCRKPNPGFWDIKHLLPAETRAYVMNFIALNVIFHNYDAFYKKKLTFRDTYCLEPVTDEPAYGAPLARGRGM